MRSKLACLALLAGAALGLAGCSYLHATGPCFGTGCPSHTVGEKGHYKMGRGPEPATAAKTATPASPASTAPATQAATAPTQKPQGSSPWAKIKGLASSLR